MKFLGFTPRFILRTWRAPRLHNKCIYRPTPLVSLRLSTHYLPPAADDRADRKPTIHGARGVPRNAVQRKGTLDTPGNFIYSCAW